MPRDRRLAALVLALALAVAAGCSGPGSGGSADSSQGAGDSGQAGAATEDSGAAPQTESSGAETAASGGQGGVSVELAGLPVGGGSASDLDGAWCQALFWGGQLPDGVKLTIDAVQVADAGATLQPVGCENVPPCVGASITIGQSGCAVVLTPPSPEPASVKVRLDGTLTCPDQATCDELTVTGGAWFEILDPSPGSAGDASPSGG